MNEKFGPNYPVLVIGVLPGIIAMLCLILTWRHGNFMTSTIVLIVCIPYVVLIGARFGARIELSENYITIKESALSAVKKIKWTDIEKLNYLKSVAMGDAIIIKDKNSKRTITISRFISHNRELIKGIITKYSQFHNIQSGIPSDLYASSGWQMVLWLAGTATVLCLLRVLFIH
jgi:hypothetical protein